MPGPPLLGSCTLPSGVSLSPGVWPRAIDPVNCPVGPVLEFLQERLTAGVAATTLRVYVAAIADRRELDEIPPGEASDGLCLLCVASEGLGRLAPWQFLLGTCQSSSKV